MTEQAVQELGYREVELRRLYPPADFEVVKRDPIVERLALSIQSMGLLDPLTVRFSDMRLGPGARRLAALLRLQEETCFVRLVECDDYTLELMRRAHNSDRTEWETAELHSSTTARIKLTAELILRLKPSMRPFGAGKTPSAHSEAIRLIARETGASEDTVRRRESRERFKKDPVIRRGPVQESSAPTIALLGIEVTELFLEQVASVQALMDDARSNVALARRVLNKLLTTTDLPRHMTRLRRILELCQETEAALQEQRPACICPWCKGQPGIQESCAACEKTGYGTDAQLEGAPKKLLSAKRSVVVMNGQELALERYLSTAPGED